MLDQFILMEGKVFQKKLAKKKKEVLLRMLVLQMILYGRLSLLILVNPTDPLQVPYIEPVISLAQDLIQKSLSLA